MSLHRIGGKLLLFGLACMVGLTAVPTDVLAITDNGPDAAEFAGGRYVLADSDNTGDLSYMEIPIYYTGRTNPGTANMLIYDVACYEACDQRIIVEEDYGRRYTSDSNVTISDFSWHAATGTWRTVVSFRLVNGSSNESSTYYRNRIAFRLDVASDYLVGNATGGASGWFNIIAADPSAGLPSLDYSVQFATPCDISSNTYNYISLFDLDSGQNDNEKRSISIGIRDVTGGGSVPVAFNPSGGTGQNQVYSLGMTFQPGHKYVLNINNVSHINLIQYRFPYDNASYVTTCPVTPRYSLTPSVTVSPNVAEAGANISASPRVANSGPTTSATVNWRLTKINAPPIGTVPNSAGGNSNAEPCGTYFSPPGITCSTVASGNSKFRTDGTVAEGDALSVYNGVLDDVEAGSQVCFALSVNPRISDGVGDQWAHSPPRCILVSKKPKVQVLGGDMLSFGSIRTSTSTKSSLTYGSWGEYMVTATGTVTGMASARGYANGSNSVNFCAVSYLTLANATGGTCTGTTVMGGYSAASRVSAVNTLFSRTTSRGDSPTIDVGTDVGGIYTATGTVRLTASQQVAAGRSIIINAPLANVVIADDITYENGPFTTAANIPQVVIIANSIRIEGGVSRVDAWLIASGADGTINTCSDVVTANNLRTLNCQNQLTVNGPVFARRILLYRTAGSGAGVASGNPAEVFNLRPDAYMWLSYRQSLTPKAQTVVTIELPPRF